MSDKKFYKVVCTPPKRFGSEKDRVFGADSYKRAQQISDWFILVEWEGFPATSQIVSISEEDYKKLVP